MGAVKKAPSQPAPPDPAATAAAQGAANKEAAISSAIINMINQQGPFGSLTYSKIGEESGTPRFQATTTLSPEQQNLLNQQTQGQTALNQLGLDQLGRITASVSDPFSYAGLPELQTPNFDQAYLDSERTRIESALFDRLNPQLARDRQALETSLANQGITLGSEAYNQAIDELNRQENDLRLGIVGSGAQERASLLSQQLASAQFGNAARQQAIQERAYARDRPLAELTSFMSGGAPQMPQFTSMPQVQIQPADIMGATYGSYQGALNNYNTEMARKNAQMGAIAGLAGSALGGWSMGGFKGF